MATSQRLGSSPLSSVSGSLSPSPPPPSKQPPASSMRPRQSSDELSDAIVDDSKEVFDDGDEEEDDERDRRSPTSSTVPMRDEDDGSELSDLTDEDEEDERQIMSDEEGDEEGVSGEELGETISSPRGMDHPQNMGLKTPTEILEDPDLAKPTEEEEAAPEIEGDEDDVSGSELDEDEASPSPEKIRSRRGPSSSSTSLTPPPSTDPSVPKALPSISPRISIMGAPLTLDMEVEDVEVNEAGEDEGNFSDEDGDVTMRPTDVEKAEEAGGEAELEELANGHGEEEDEGDGDNEPAAEVNDEPHEVAEEEVEDDEDEEAEAAFPIPMRASGYSHSSHALPPTPAAMRSLVMLELKLAALRDRLYVERMEEAAKEEEMIINGTHPALTYLHKTLAARRGRLHEVASKRHQQALDELVRVREADKEGVWTWWTDERDRMHWDEFEHTWSKRRRLAREKNEIETPRLFKAVPRADRPQNIHHFDWSTGATPAKLSTMEGLQDLAMMDSRRQQPIPSRHASPAHFTATHGLMSQYAPNSTPQQPPAPTPIYAPNSTKTVYIDDTPEAAESSASALNRQRQNPTPSQGLLPTPTGQARSRTPGSVNRQNPNRFDANSGTPTAILAIHSGLLPSNTVTDPAKRAAIYGANPPPLHTSPAAALLATQTLNQNLRREGRTVPTSSDNFELNRANGDKEVKTELLGSSETGWRGGNGFGGRAEPVAGSSASNGLGISILDRTSGGGISSTPGTNTGTGLGVSAPPTSLPVLPRPSTGLTSSSIPAPPEPVRVSPVLVNGDRGGSVVASSTPAATDQPVKPEENGKSNGNGHPTLASDSDGNQNGDTKAVPAASIPDGHDTMEVDVPPQKSVDANAMDIDGPHAELKDATKVISGDNGDSSTF